MKRCAALAGLIGGIATLFPVACSSDDGGAPDSQSDAGTDRESDRHDVAVDDARDTDVDAGPVYNQDGWVRVDFDPNCAFFAAPSAAKMPPPIKWQACDQGLNPSGWTCKQIEFDWPASTKLAQSAGPSQGAWVGPGSTVFLLVSRYSGSFIFDLVAEADGPVHTAVSTPYGKCFITSGSVSAGRVGFGAVREDSSGKDHRGLIAGSIDEVPSVRESAMDGVGRTSVVGENYYFTYPDNRLNDWDVPSKEVARLNVADPGQVGSQRFVGDTLFFDVADNSYGRIKTFTVSGGLKDLVSYGNDVAKNAVDFGTDGIDMVWDEGTGRAGPAPAPWDKVEIFTAKFTTDASVVQAEKRRLRSEVGGIGVTPYTVGCGYAAHQFSSASGTGTRLVRLSDGRSWRFTRVDAADGGPPYVINEPLAITCEELFLQFNHNQQFNVARIRIDSLGAGEAAD